MDLKKQKPREILALNGGIKLCGSLRIKTTEILLLFICNLNFTSNKTWFKKQ